MTMNTMTTELYTKSGYKLLLDLLPEDLFIECQERSERTSEDSWRIGEITVELKKIVREHQLPVTMPDVYKTVEALHDGEISARKAEYCAGVYEFYHAQPFEVVNKYYDFKFYRFALARSYGANWEICFQVTLDYMDNHGGRLPTKEWIRLKMAGIIDEMEQQEWEDRQPTDEELALATVQDEIMYDEMEEPEKPIGARPFIALQAALAQFSSRLNALPVDPELLKRFRLALAEVSNLTAEIIQELDLHRKN